MKPIRIVLTESSGPVAPRYQYALTVEVTGLEGGGAEVHVMNRRPEAAGGDVEVRGTIDADRWEVLTKEVRIEGNMDLVPGGPRRTGVSYNKVCIEPVGQPTRSFVYLLGRLELEENAQQRAVVERLKALADEIVRNPS